MATTETVQASDSTARALLLASFPGPAQLFEVRKSGRGPGIFYHVSDVEGREKVERT